MKHPYIFYVGAVLLAVLCFFFPNRGQYNSNLTKQVQVGPTSPYTWKPARIISADGVYSLKSDTYFEVRQGNNIKQALLEAPEFGSKNGLYWIREIKMTGGSWEISATADLIGLSDSTVTSAVKEDTIVSNYFGMNALLTVIFILLMMVWTLLYLTIFE